LRDALDGAGIDCRCRAVGGGNPALRIFTTMPRVSEMEFCGNQPRYERRVGNALEAGSALQKTKY